MASVGCDLLQDLLLPTSAQRWDLPELLMVSA